MASPSSGKSPLMNSLMNISACAFAIEQSCSSCSQRGICSMRVQSGECLDRKTKLLCCFLEYLSGSSWTSKPQSNCSQFQLTVFSTQRILKLNSSPSLVFDDVDHCSGEDLFTLLPIRVRRSFLQYCEVWQQAIRRL